MGLDICRNFFIKQVSYPPPDFIILPTFKILKILHISITHFSYLRFPSIACTSLAIIDTIIFPTAFPNPIFASTYPSNFSKNSRNLITYSFYHVSLFKRYQPSTSNFTHR